jgi:hypothetical protein
MNDNGYAFDIAANLLQMARPLFGSRQSALKDAQRQLSLEDSDLNQVLQ